ncbi:MAG: YCF48-related protein, partial [bacterium]
MASEIIEPFTIKIDSQKFVQLEGTPPFEIKITPEKICLAVVQWKTCFLSPLEIGPFNMSVKHSKGSYEVKLCNIEPVYWSIIAGEKGLILHSRKNCTNWKEIHHGVLLTDFTSVIYVSPIHIIAGGWNNDYSKPGNAIIVSRDGGDTWQSAEFISLENSSRMLRINVIRKANRDIIFAGTEKGLVLKSTDGGTKWSIVNRELKKEFGPIKDMYFFTPWEGYVLTSNYGLWKTEDGGKSWQKTFKRTQNAKSLHFLGHKFIAIADDVERGFIYRSKYGGLKWDKYTLGTDLNHGGAQAVYFFDNKYGVAASQKSIYYTENGGRKWIPAICQYEAALIAKMIFPFKSMGF